MSDLSRKSRWAHEAIGPAQSILGQAARGLVDLLSDVSPGARQVAQLTALRSAQDYALVPVRSALEELAQLPDWSGGFLVADKVDFDWRTAPFRRYQSAGDFYQPELKATWDAWEEVHAHYRRVFDH